MDTETETSDENLGVSLPTTDYDTSTTSADEQKCVNQTLSLSDNIPACSKVESTEYKGSNDNKCQKINPVTTALDEKSQLQPKKHVPILIKKEQNLDSICTPYEEITTQIPALVVDKSDTSALTLQQHAEATLKVDQKPIPINSPIPLASVGKLSNVIQAPVEDPPLTTNQESLSRNVGTNTIQYNQSKLVDEKLSQQSSNSKQQPLDINVDPTTIHCNATTSAISSVPTPLIIFPKPIITKVELPTENNGETPSVPTSLIKFPKPIITKVEFPTKHNGENKIIPPLPLPIVEKVEPPTESNEYDLIAYQDDDTPTTKQCNYTTKAASSGVLDSSTIRVKQELNAQRNTKIDDNNHDDVPAEYFHDHSKPVPLRKDSSAADDATSSNVSSEFLDGIATTVRSYNENNTPSKSLTSIVTTDFLDGIRTIVLPRKFPTYDTNQTVHVKQEPQKNRSVNKDSSDDLLSNNDGFQTPLPLSKDHQSSQQATLSAAVTINAKSTVQNDDDLDGTRTVVPSQSQTSQSDVNQSILDFENIEEEFFNDLLSQDFIDHIEKTTMRNDIQTKTEEFKKGNTDNESEVDEEEDDFLDDLLPPSTIKADPHANQLEDDVPENFLDDLYESQPKIVKKEKMQAAISDEEYTKKQQKKQKRKKKKKSTQSRSSSEESEPRRSRSIDRSSRVSEQAQSPSQHERGNKNDRKSPNRNRDYRREHRSRSKERRSRSKERRSRSKEYRSRSERYRTRSKERRSRSKEHRSRSKEYRSRSKERRSRSKERRSRSKERRIRNRTKERRSRSKERRSRSKERRIRSRTKERRSRSKERHSTSNSRALVQRRQNQFIECDYGDNPATSRKQSFVGPNSGVKVISLPTSGLARQLQVKSEYRTINLYEPRDYEPLACLPVAETLPTFKPITLIKQEVKKENPPELPVEYQTVEMKRELARKRVSAALARFRLNEKKPNRVAGFVHTPTITQIETKNILTEQYSFHSRSPLQANCNVLYSFSSTASELKLDTWGLQRMSESSAIVMRTLGYDATTLHEKLRTIKLPPRLLKIKQEAADAAKTAAAAASNVQIVDLTGSCLFAHAMTQTDKVTVLNGRQRARYDVSTQVHNINANEKAVQTNDSVLRDTTSTDAVVANQLVGLLNANQRLALQEFIGLLKEPRPDFLDEEFENQTVERLEEIFKISQIPTTKK